MKRLQIAGMDGSDTASGAATVSMAAVLVAAGFYFVAAPYPEADEKLGATRTTAVAPDTVPASDSSRLADVKIIGAAADSGKPCHEQTWPYIEQRCLTPAKDAQREAALAQPLGVRDLLLGIRVPTFSSAPAEATATGTTAELSAPPVTDIPANDALPNAVADNTGARPDRDIPLPQPRPEKAFAAIAGDDLAILEEEDGEVDPPFYAAPPPPPWSRAEQRRMEREWRRMERAERRAFEDSIRMSRREAHSRAERDINRAFDRFIRHFR